MSCHHGKLDGCAVCEEIAAARERVAEVEEAALQERNNGAQAHFEVCQQRDEARREASTVQRRLWDLLAVIHRDGGHHREMVGEEKAVADALHGVTRDRREAEELRADAERYIWLRGRLYGFDSDICSDGLAVIFRFPIESRIGAGPALDAAIDAAGASKP